jgi:hypothetical protein
LLEYRHGNIQPEGQLSLVRFLYKVLYTLTERLSLLDESNEYFFLFVISLALFSQCNTGTGDLKTTYRLSLFIVGKTKLKPGAPIIMKDDSIGNIFKIKTFKNADLVELSIDKNFKIPLDSHLTIVQKNGTEGSEALLVIVSDKTKFYMNSDTIFSFDRSALSTYLFGELLNKDSLKLK